MRGYLSCRIRDDGYTKGRCASGAPLWLAPLLCDNQRMRFLQRVIRLGVLTPLLVLSCAAEYVEEQAPMRVSVSLPSDIARRGTPFEINVNVRNTGTKSVTLTATTGCFTDYEVLPASSDTVLGTSGQMCTQAITSRALNAGEGFTVRHLWTPGGLGQLDLPPGSYRIRGILLLERGDARGEAVPFTIVPP